MEVPVTRRPAILVRIGAAGWALAALCTLLSIHSSGARAVTDSNDAAASAPQATTLQTTNGTLTLGLVDAQAMARSLRNFLETDPSVAAIPMLDANSGAWLRSGDQPFIDSRGFVRIGLWLLQARGNDLVLTWREPGAVPGKVGYQYIASVGRTGTGSWHVTGIAWEKILAR